ncbi:hypothetical protein DVH24_035113 [Malus domestica]|uniref:Uncharacterized protein n=1 Tax=Malus domestica TaxID=3750 RepID=A0A498II29_MALDO|nr:hypothetical protein DVH24_035113 [Malus domestica]
MAGLHLPDLLRTKSSKFSPPKLRFEWAGVWCTSSVLDFDEGGYEESLDCQDNLGDQHRKFINNILKRYLKFCGHD